jgi:Zn-dependent protease
VQLKRLRGAKTPKLWALHQQRLQAVRDRNIVPVHNRDELFTAVERHHVLLRDFNLARGVFRPRSAEQKAKAAAYLASVAQARASGLEHAEVMVELDKLQEQKPGWKSAIWVLLGSLVLFVAAGAAQWNWKFTLWLIPTLFIHESGHWLAMRGFKYRNLRMFFIPFFGAAVTGRNWNVPGWKKVLVSLAGPLPGIALGAVATIFGLVLHKPWLNEAALILLIVNGFNLLPVLPLDGGHVFHAILFCRNRWLDGAFRIVAILGLLGMTALGSGRLLMYLAIFMAISLPVAFKLAKVTDKLRATPLPPPLPSEDRIPTQTAQAIITEIKAALPKGAGKKAIAQHTLNVFETLNAKPPGVWASIGLLAAHAGGFLTVVLFGTLLVIAQHGGFGDFFKAAVRQPQHGFHCGDTFTWRGKEAPDHLPLPGNLLIATLDARAKAAATFAGLTNRLPANSQLTLFGDSVLLALPAQDDAAREKWFDELQTYSTNLFVAVSNQPVNVRLMTIAPTTEAATNMNRELRDYFEVTAGLNLIPPWSPATNTPGFDAKVRARRDWRRIGQEETKAWSDPALKAFGAKISAASKRGAAAELKRLIEEQQKLGEELQRQARERLRTSSTNGIDPDLLDLHAALAKLDFTNRVARVAVLRRVAAKLGEVAYQADRPAPGADAFGTTYGSTARHGLVIEIPFAAFRDPSVALPALMQWLCDRKCAGIRYEFVGSYPNTDFDELEESLQ